MQKPDLITRAVAGFVDLLLVIGLSRLPDVIGFLGASGYILIRDGLFTGSSIGKRVIGLRVILLDDPLRAGAYRESIIRNIPFALAYALFIIPYAGWVLGPLALFIEWLTALGDDKGMRIGDLLAGTSVVPDASVSAASEVISETPGPFPKPPDVEDEGRS